MVLEEHFDLATMLFIRHAVKEEKDFDAKSCTYCQEGGDEDLIRIAIFSGVRDDGTNRLDADNEINRSHTVVKWVCEKGSLRRTMRGRTRSHRRCSQLWLGVHRRLATC
jgi:hypothetical protein